MVLAAIIVLFVLVNLYFVMPRKPRTPAPRRSARPARLSVARRTTGWPAA